MTAAASPPAPDAVPAPEDEPQSGLPATTAAAAAEQPAASTAAASLLSLSNEEHSRRMSSYTYDDLNKEYEVGRAPGPGAAAVRRAAVRAVAAHE